MLKRVLPLLFFLIIVLVLWRGMGLHSSQVPSPLINKPAPTFRLPTLFDDSKTATNKDFIGHVTLLNVWATWCYTCAQEHEFLSELAKKESLFLFGLNYKDDTQAAKQWIDKFGNPYKIIAVDTNGIVAIDFGVYGTPETFVIDKKGIIRYKHTGPLTITIWENELKPLIQKLQSESA